MYSTLTHIKKLTLSQRSVTPRAETDARSALGAQHPHSDHSHGHQPVVPNLEDMCIDPQYENLVSILREGIVTKAEKMYA
jgi:hypothetical protein